MSIEMEISADEHETKTLFHLEPMWCSQTGNVKMMRCGACTRKSARLRASGWVWCLHTPSHSRLLLLAECETRIHQLCRKNVIETRPDMRSDFVVVGDNVELFVSESNGTRRLVALTTS